jgi:toxin ParE1/3/4
MTHAIVWAPQALEDIEAAFDYLMERNPEAARRVCRDILYQIEMLAKQPFFGRAGRVPGTRELVVTSTPFIVPYRVHQERLEIIRVFHSARQWPEEF